MSFQDSEANKRLLKYSFDQHPQLYGAAHRERSENRAVIPRENGDNFCGAGRKKTEQDSFNILNIWKLVSSLLGQFCEFNLAWY